jgi:hypothetical protein
MIMPRGSALSRHPGQALPEHHSPLLRIRPGSGQPLPGRPPNAAPAALRPTWLPSQDAELQQLQAQLQRLQAAADSRAHRAGLQGRSELLSLHDAQQRVGHLRWPGRAAFVALPARGGVQSADGLLRHTPSFFSTTGCFVAQVLQLEQQLVEQQQRGAELQQQLQQLQPLSLQELQQEAGQLKGRLEATEAVLQKAEVDKGALLDYIQVGSCSGCWAAQLDSCWASQGCLNLFRRSLPADTMARDAALRRPVVAGVPAAGAAGGAGAAAG